MPRKPKRPCRYPGCPNLTDGIYCEEHASVMERHYEKFQRGYSPGKRYGRAWVRIRHRYATKHPLCEKCLKEGRYIAVEEVHHIVPLSEGDAGGVEPYEPVPFLPREDTQRARATAEPQGRSKSLRGSSAENGAGLRVRKKRNQKGNKGGGDDNADKIE